MNYAKDAMDYASKVRNLDFFELTTRLHDQFTSLALTKSRVISDDMVQAPRIYMRYFMFCPMLLIAE